MNPDYVILMNVANSKHSIARSAREPRLTSLRMRLAALIWPGELDLPIIEQPLPAASC